MRIWMFLTVMALAIFAAPAATPAWPTAWAAARAANGAQGVAELAFQSSRHGLLIVDIEINGSGPYPFLVDTGAGATIFDTELIEELGLASAARLITVHGVIGVTEMPAYLGADLDLGGLSAAPDLVLAHDLDLGDARGVLGSDVLTKFVIEIDNAANVLRIHTDGYRPPRRAEVVRVRMTIDQYGLPYVRLRVNRKRITALIDTGFYGIIVRPDAARRARVSMRRSNTDVHDIADESANVARLGRARLRIGQAHWPVSDVLVHDAPVFDRLIGADPADAIIGANLFTDAVLVLDYDRRYVYIVLDRRRRRGS